jgi:ABC-type transporter Mla maintaining outer membrane lipid asymmetry permease subunit MlaE
LTANFGALNVREVNASALARPLNATGDFFVLAGETFAAMFRRPFAWRELLDQIWFVARVSIVPTIVLSIPYTVSVGGGPTAVGNAVNETVVFAFMALFLINILATAFGVKVAP